MFRRKSEKTLCQSENRRSRRKNRIWPVASILYEFIRIRVCVCVCVCVYEIVS